MKLYYPTLPIEEKDEFLKQAIAECAQRIGSLIQKAIELSFQKKKTQNPIL